MAAASASASLVPICRLANSGEPLYGIRQEEQKKIVETLFGKVDKARSVYEGVKADKQCEIVLGALSENESIPLDKRITIINTCWICGLEFTDDIISVLGNSICEHVLPIIQAVMYIGLFYSPYYESLNNEEKYITHDDGKNSYKERLPSKQEYIKSLYNEYRFAHDKCNLHKGEKLFIGECIDKDTGQTIFTYNDSLIKAVLTKIWENYSSSDSITFGDRNKFISNRLKEIKYTIDPIIDKMNRKDESTGEIQYVPNLTQLAAVVQLLTYPKIKKDTRKALVGGIGLPMAPEYNADSIADHIINIVYPILYEPTGTLGTYVENISSLKKNIQLIFNSTYLKDLLINNIGVYYSRFGYPTYKYDYDKSLRELKINIIHEIIETAFSNIIYGGTRVRELDDKAIANMNTLRHHVNVTYGREIIIPPPSEEDIAAAVAEAVAENSEAEIGITAPYVPISKQAATGGGSAAAAASASSALSRKDNSSVINFSEFPTHVHGARNIISISLKNNTQSAISRRTPIGEGVGGTIGQAAYALSTMRTSGAKHSAGGVNTNTIMGGARKTRKNGYKKKSKRASLTRKTKRSSIRHRHTIKRRA